MRKVFKFCTFLIVSFIFINQVKANTINDITIDIYLDKEGTAHITEVWNANLNQGTEGYKGYKNIGNARITNFKVSDRGKEYTSLDYWSTSASFNEKAYKSGIHNTGDGVELCWGISEYGVHSYKLTYDIEGFVTETTDSQMIYWNLLPAELTGYTNNVSITIHADENFEDTLDVWGYGNYGGLAYVSGGKIYMSNDNLSSGDYMTILVKFDKGTFNTYNVLNEDFNYYYNMAEDGAISYEEENKTIKNQNIATRILRVILVIVSIFLNFLPFLIIAPFIMISSRNTSNKSGKTLLDFGDTGKNLPKEVNLFRDIPCNKDIYRAYWVAKNYNLMKKQTDFLGAVILKWRRDEIIKIENNTVGKIFKKEETTIEFNTPTINSGVGLEDDLYKYMYAASKDGILESKEFEKWCKNNYSRILNWFDRVLDYVNEKLEQEGKLKKGSKKQFLFTVKTYIVDSSMKEEALQMKGLKEFFKEFDNMSDKEAIEVMFWQEYLMYAQIFGIADKVAKQFKKLYPEVITDYNYESILFINTISYSGMNSASSARAAASSYSSGGGGFSSGGGGGGSFGGGGGGGFR